MIPPVFADECSLCLSKTFNDVVDPVAVIQYRCQGVFVPLKRHQKMKQGPLDPIRLSEKVNSICKD